MTLSSLERSSNYGGLFELSRYFTLSLNSIRNRITSHGIVLKLQVLEGRKHSLTLTYTGEIWPHLVNDITYTIPNFVSQDILERAGDGYEAISTAQTAARLQIVEQIRTFTRQHERHFNSISKDVHQLYDKIRHSDPDLWTDITTPEATRFLDVRSPPPVLTLLAVHAHLMAHSVNYVADARNHRTTHRFAVRPLSHVLIIRQVDEWVRTRDPAFESFVRTARKMIRKSREVQKTYWDASPSRFEGSFPPWSPSDLTFIRYLQNALRTLRATQEDPYDRSLAAVIKSIGMYRDKPVLPGLAQLVLIELGVHAPWDDVVTRTPELRLDLAPPGQSEEAQVIDELVHHARTQPGVPVTPILRRKLHDVRCDGLTDFLQYDPLDAQRHDFGDMPVYVVDDESAQELDDGISLESVAGEPGNHWIHVHIADPTAVIPPGHVLDLQAMKKVVTFYASHRTWTMLPSALQPLFSLGSGLSADGQNVLTFSIKVSDDGDFLDYAVRAGFVRNFRLLSYDQADRFLGLENTFCTYPFPDSRPSVNSIKPLSEAFRSDLRKLREISERVLRATLVNNQTLNYKFPKAAIGFRQSLPANPLLPSTPILWKGYPSMTYTVENGDQAAHSFRQTIAEFMKLAGRAASRFCRDNGIPAIRRFSLPMEGPTPADTAHLMSLRSSGGFVDPFECVKHNLYAPPGKPTLETRGHAGLGIAEGEGYSRVTSPLRRYSDLIMHWQIKHALAPGHDRPLFSAEYLQPIMEQLYEQEKQIGAAETIYHRHWALTYLARYIQDKRRKHGPEHNPFPGLLARTTASVGYDTMNGTGQVSAVIPSLGVHGEVKGVDGHNDLPIGTSLAVKIDNFRFGLPTTLHLAPA